jgi:hypothetical protein
LWILFGCRTGPTQNVVGECGRNKFKAAAEFDEDPDEILDIEIVPGKCIPPQSGVINHA